MIKDLSFILNGLGEDRSRYFDAVAPPVLQTSKRAFGDVETMRAAMLGEGSAFVYGRGRNPVTGILEEKLAALDGAEAALVVNSGASAISAAVTTHIRSGEHIVSVVRPYYWATALFDHTLAKFGVETTYVDGTRAGHFEAAIRPNTRIIYLESPNSWTYELQDLRAVAALAKSKGILTIIDNTYSTPLYQRPLEMGIDIGLQSASKYLGGHSDVIAGVICGRRELIDPIVSGPFMTFGLQLAPMNVWLLLRGIRTLPMRLERIRTTTHQVFAFLRTHPEVDEVLFPLDPAFPQNALAREQMGDAFGLVTIVLKHRTREAIEVFCNSLEHFTLAVSWGGYESLVMPRCVTITAGDFDSGNRDHQLIRLAIGLEDAEVLIEDLRRALSGLST